MDNMMIYNKLRRPPREALKPIGAGRLKGMTDIKPQWRIEIMTEVFGPCGFGWKYTIEDMRMIEGYGDLKVASVEINLYVEHEGKWSDPIPGIGGSMLVAKENAGPYTSDEAFKMATTDAISNAMKYLGVAADIYSGLWDGSKYKDIDHRFKPGEKDKIYTSVKEALESGDEHGVMEVLSEYKSPEEKMKVWALFNSTERAAIKAITENAA